MDVFEAIRTRRSIREYSPKLVPKKILHKIAESAQLAPSASNLQPWHFIFVTDRDERKQLSEGRWAGFLAESPVVVVGCGDQKASPSWYRVDVTIALEHIVLAATSKGLGTCWVGSFDEEEVKKMLKIPENYRVVSLLALGYPLEKLKKKPSGKAGHPIRNRKGLDQIVSYEEFGKQSG